MTHVLDTRYSTKGRRRELRNVIIGGIMELLVQARL
jgi:hypothetical protein